MRRKATIVGISAALLMLTILVLFPATKAYACSCASGTPKEKKERSAAVFSGKVVQRNWLTKKIDNQRTRQYTFKVEKAWKGVDERRISVYSYDGDSSTCGFAFKQGESYLVYAYESNGRLVTNLCSGNVPIDSAVTEIDQLGEAKTKLKEVNEESLLQVRYPAWIVNSLGIAVLVLVVVLIWKWSRANR